MLLPLFYSGLTSVLLILLFLYYVYLKFSLSGVGVRPLWRLTDIYKISLGNKIHTVSLTYSMYE